MNLLSISVVFPPAWHHGGTPVTAHAVAKALIHQGHNILAICTGDTATDGSPVLDEMTTWDGVPVVYCRRLPFRYLSYSPSLVQRVGHFLPQHDVAMIRSVWQHTGPAASRECRRLGIPYLAYPEGGLDPWGLQRGRLRKVAKAAFWRAFDREYLERASAVVALSQSEASSILATGIRTRVECIPNGVDISQYQVGTCRRSLEERYPILQGRRIVLFLSRLHPKKGLLEMLPAVRGIARRFPGVLLVIAGPSEEGYQAQLERRVRELDLTNHVTFTGTVVGQDKVSLLQAAEIFVLPSFSEGFPVVVLEALACSRPIVLTTACNVPEVAQAGAGIEISHSVAEFEKALVELLSDDAARQQMGRNAYQLVLERFTWDRVARMTAELCRDVAR